MKQMMTYSKIILCCILAWMNLTTYAQQDPPLIHSGKQYLLNGELDQAIIKFSEQLKQHGFDREAYYWRAHCLIQMERYDAAQEDLRRVLHFHPNDSRTMDAMGYAFNQQGNYLEGINWFNKAINNDEENAIIYNNRGMSYYYLGKYSTAFYDFNKAIHLDSTFAEAYSNRGSARYNNQNIAAATEIDLRKAEADYSKALELDNTLVSAYRNRGIIRYHMEKYREGYLDLQKAIYLSPDDAIVYFHMGNLMQAKESYQEAVNYYGECMKRDLSLAEAFYRRADAYEAIGNLKLARYDLQSLIDINGEERGKSYYRMARTYAMEQQWEEVERYLNLARKYDYFKDTDRRQRLFNDPLFGIFWEKSLSKKLKGKLQKS